MIVSQSSAIRARNDRDLTWLSSKLTLRYWPDQALSIQADGINRDMEWNQSIHITTCRKGYMICSAGLRDYKMLDG